MTVPDVTTNFPTPTKPAPASAPRILLEIIFALYAKMSHLPDDALHEDGLEKTFQALDDVTDKTNEHEADPKDHLHKPAHEPASHSWLSSWLPSWNYIETIEASYHLGNFVRDRDTDEKAWETMSIYVRLGMHLLYYGTYQQVLLSTQRVLGMLEAQSKKMGKQYDDPASKAHIQPFIDSFGLHGALEELLEPDPTKYETFNHFFARQLKAGARPPDEPDNENVASSPADCRLTAFPTIDLATHFWVKGANFTMARLFRDEHLAEMFDGGSMIIARLAPQDYHRWHSPVTGTVKSVKEIPGAYYTVNPQAINEVGTLNVYCENRRSIMLVETATCTVAIVAVGAMLVGSIRYLDGVGEPGAKITRGQCLGGFYYGGSTVLVLFPKDAVELDEDLVKWSTHEEGPCETYMKVGWRVGQIYSDAS